MIYLMEGIKMLSSLKIFYLKLSYNKLGKNELDLKYLVDGLKKISNL